MNTDTYENSEAHIQLLHIQQTEDLKLTKLIDRIWFFYELKKTNTKEEEEKLFQTFNNKSLDINCDILFTDLTPTSPLTRERQQQLIDFLRYNRCPLISLNEKSDMQVHDQDPNWLHIELPKNQLDKHLDEANNIIANFWFNLPSLKQTASQNI